MADSLWRECAEWLIKQQVILPDHRVTWPEAQVIDLVYTLRDGVVLCQLLNKLVPECIDLKEISLRPQLSQVYNIFLLTWNFVVVEDFLL